MRRLVHAHAQIEKSLIAVGLLDDGQVGALAVLHEHEFALLPFRQIGHHGGHPAQSGELGGGEAAMTDDEQVASLRGGRDEQVLPDTLHAYRIREFRHIAHVAARVRRVRVDESHVQHDDARFVRALAGRGGSFDNCGFHDCLLEKIR